MRGLGGVWVIGWAMVIRGRGRGRGNLLTLGRRHVWRLRSGQARLVGLFSFKGISFINWSDLMKKRPPTLGILNKSFKIFD